ncbi:tail collar protein [Cohnella kolymensis]|uniref:Tail collar protein n=1 Tax=Cohnella kolymensis TaxID=1590652 RepID=A0ABR5A3G0_9BACL|nr:tail fiber protein [Cohnella kolymensis]KIL35593.1 tail collar protein [Cohnella kolymensis]
MSEPFLGQIQAFPYGFVPRGWAACNGQLLQINTNQALFSLLGNIYGGDGRTNFALPDLRGRVPVHADNSVPLGRAFGEEAHTLTVNEIPAHNHLISANTSGSTSSKPSGNVWGVTPDTASSYTTSANTQMSPAALANSGGSQAHSNMQPYLVLTYCIALTGIFPSRN